MVFYLANFDKNGSIGIILRDEGQRENVLKLSKLGLESISFVSRWIRNFTTYNSKNYEISFGKKGTCCMYQDNTNQVLHERVGMNH